MAKKSRTPPPPRRVQAPKKRTGHRHEAAGRRRLTLLAAAGAVGVVVAALVLVLAFGGGDATPVPETMRAAGCTYREVNAKQNMPEGQARHVLKLPKGFKYNTDPPTSGLHHPQTVIWGIYDSPVRQLSAVHNLEHGGIVIQYGSGVGGGAIRGLTEFYQDDPNGIIVAPLPRLGDRISLAAWTFDLARLSEQNYEGEGRLALCPRFDEGAFRAFRDEYRGHGPEPADVDTDLVPGNP